MAGVRPRGEDPDWQEAEYARTMGSAALGRQKTAQSNARKVRHKEAKCICGWKLEKGVTPGPHHDPPCDYYEA